MTDQEPTAPRGLLAGSMMAGSVSVTAAVLITMPVPNPWWVPAWLVLSAVFCTIAGLWLGSVLAAEEERADA